MPNRALTASRTTSKTVATKPGCVPLKEMYERAVSSKPKTWNAVEHDFLRAMEGFDANVASGAADIGDLQNGKGDFFNDLLALLLENCAGVTLYSRGGVPGLMFPKHNLDVTFPSTGAVEFLLEAGSRCSLRRRRRLGQRCSGHLLLCAGLRVRPNDLSAGVRALARRARASVVPCLPRPGGSEEEPSARRLDHSLKTRRFYGAPSQRQLVAGVLVGALHGQSHDRREFRWDGKPLQDVALETDEPVCSALAVCGEPPSSRR